jgi:SAM-dependent methyltransferase
MTCGIYAIISRMWDDRYATDEYRFGTQPNRFLEDCVHLLPPGAKVLSLGEGEGRNAVYLAGLGCDVTAVDCSAVGLAKARRLASGRGVALTTVTADLNDYPIQPAAWDAIINFFCHMPTAERAPLHQRVVAGLKPGGAYILELFNPDQPRFGSGGPTDRDLLMSVDDARRELPGLDLRVARELTRRRDDADPSTPLVAVLQVLGILE